MNRTKPIFLLAGGPGSRRSGTDPLLQAVFAATGKRNPSIAYIGSASEDDAGFFAMISKYFRQSGAAETNLIRTVKRFDPVASLKAMEQSDCLFFSGGDVERGMQIIARRGLLPIIQKLMRSSRVLFGLSAGSIMLARHWVRWRDENDESSTELFDCLGVAPVLCDTHGEADKWDELDSLLKIGPENSIGYGIATGTAIRVDPDASVHALGGAVQRFTKKKGTIVPLDDLIPSKAGK